MLVGLCDEIMAATAAGGIAQRPGLMTMLRSSISRALELAGPVVAAVDEDATPLEMVNDDERRDELAATAVPLQVLPPPWTPPLVPLNGTTFAIRLVEMTLSRACLYLSGDAYISVADYERAFGTSLRTLTQAQLLTRLRWLLGPGRPSLYESSSTFRDPQHGLVTATDVQEQLQGLGARDLGLDIMELRIGERRGPEDVAPGMVVQINTSILTASLARAAVCLDQGPAYPYHEVQKAVEASVILARGP
jgi:hypothetical protein